jgi:hypothetical protein
VKAADKTLRPLVILGDEGSGSEAFFFFDF